MMGELCTID